MLARICTSGQAARTAMRATRLPTAQIALRRGVRVASAQTPQQPGGESEQQKREAATSAQQQREEGQQQQQQPETQMAQRVSRFRRFVAWGS